MNFSDELFWTQDGLSMHLHEFFHEQSCSKTHATDRASQATEPGKRKSHIVTEGYLESSQMYFGEGHGLLLETADPVYSQQTLARRQSLLGLSRN